MNKKLFAVLGIVALLVALLPAAVGAAPPIDDIGEAFNVGNNIDDLPHPLGEKQRALHQNAVIDKAMGEAKGKVHEVAKGQYVELEREGEDLIWTVLADFGNETSPIPVLQSPDPGPQHNQIPEPDRDFDNTTIWVPDFNQDYYLDVLFSQEPGAISMRNFYIEQSSNRYTVDGDVTDWVQVPYNTAHYGRYDSTVWWFVDDAVDNWYARMMADEGWGPAEFEAYLSKFDVWDRYDYDEDGNFDEPDGYIDHFQAVHAGMGEEAGGGSYGGDAIWSHRWYAYFTNIGADGPAFNPSGGVEIGDTGYWIGDYTVEPENGGVGVFAHEFAHDLGLPDLYNTAGGGSGAENSTAFWTLMSSGSWLSQDPTNIGSAPNHMGIWEKFQLGWLNYETAYAGQKSEHKLGPAETNTKQAQGLLVVLPEKEVTFEYGPAEFGDYYYFSRNGDDLDNWMVKGFTLPADASLCAKVNYDIEADYDYAYVVISTDGGENWSSVATSLSDDPGVNNGISGDSGGLWIDLTADLSAYTGDVMLGFRYWTDGGVALPGFKVDEIEVTGNGIDGGETDTGWIYDPAGGEGFIRTTGTETNMFFNAYLAAFRQYRGFDAGLETGPYNFGFLDNPDLGDWVEHFPYQPGLLISYWDTSQPDNNTINHPGAGLILPVDAHPENMIRADGGNWRGRIQAYDSTFGFDPTTALELHWNSQTSYHPSQPGVPVFDDNNQYWNPETPVLGVMNPHTGTQIRIKSISAHGSFMQVEVRPSK